MPPKKWIVTKELMTNWYYGNKRNASLPIKSHNDLCDTFYTDEKCKNIISCPYRHSQSTDFTNPILCMIYEYDLEEVITFYSKDGIRYYFDVDCTKLMFMWNYEIDRCIKDNLRHAGIFRCSDLPRQCMTVFIKYKTLREKYLLLLYLLELPKEIIYMIITNSIRDINNSIKYKFDTPSATSLDHYFW